jgi:ribosomal protein S7
MLRNFRLKTIDNLVRNLIKKGHKEKAFKIIFIFLTLLKKRLKLRRKKLFKNVFHFLFKVLVRLENRIELRIKRQFGKKKKKKQIKLRGRIFYVGGLRAHRRAVKDFVKSSKIRIDDTLSEKLNTEIIEMSKGKGYALKKKLELFSTIEKLRPSLTHIKKKIRRKRIKRV